MSFLENNRNVMDLCYFLVSFALFTSVVVFSLPYGSLGFDKNVTLIKIVKRLAPRPLAYCSYPGDIANGRVNISKEEYPEGSRLQYSCVDGYVLESPTSLTCTNASKWSSAPPTCIRASRPLAYCPFAGDIANGWVNISTLNEKRRPFDESEGEYPEGSRLQYSCVDGYTLEGPTSLTCTKTSKWSAAPPTCITVTNTFTYCQYPGDIINGRVVHHPNQNERMRSYDEREDEYPERSQLKYSCNDGYTLEGSSTVTCQSTGSWSSGSPKCKRDVRAEIKYCENPGLVLNGRAEYIPPDMNHSGDPISDEYPEQSVLEYLCDEVYRLQGRRSVTCLSTGIWSGKIPSCVPDCGRSFMQTHDRVTNGSNTISGDWPWVVSISVDNKGTVSFICGGAVLNTHTVITAAHCLTGPFVSGRTLILRFGKHHFGIQGDDEEVLVRRSSRVIVHPDYSNKTFDSDIGLVFFRHRIRYSPRVQPICLPTRHSTALNIIPRRVGYVGGWGETADEVTPDVMMLSSLPVVSKRQCEDEYKQHNLVMTSNMFCAGYEDARQSVCGGDSGSPFVFYDESIQRYILEGLVSFSESGQCGVVGKYAIFTKVSRFLYWMKNYIRN